MAPQLLKYQEQSQLLDAHLESIVVPLATLMRQQAVAPEPDLDAIQGVCRLLTSLVVVRGYKTVVRFFPHEAADLERVLHVLLLVKAAPAAAAGDDGQGAGRWEAQTILLLWLSILILTPFALSTVDSANVTDTNRCVQTSAVLACRASWMWDVR